MKYTVISKKYTGIILLWFSSNHIWQIYTVYNSKNLLTVSYLTGNIPYIVYELFIYIYMCM